MTVYRYDGSFEGFLCALVRCREDNDGQPEFVRDGEEIAAGLFSGETCQVNTVRSVALALRSRFVKRVSQDAFATARYAFHSQQAGIEQLVWRYLSLGLEVGRRLGDLLTTEPVHAIGRIARHVAHEAHKFKGFVRFRELSAGFLYAAIEPQADILVLIASHFVDRLGDRPWMIHDLHRSQAVVFDLHSWRLIRGVELTSPPGTADEEDAYAALWQRYFQQHAIQERHNLALQQKHVPLRVRKHLTEFTIP